MKLKWWQRILCRWMCPRFIADMPEDKPGMWVACAIKVSHRGRLEDELRHVQGLRNAYTTARWLALKLDWRLHPELGVEWAVRELKQGNAEPCGGLPSASASGSQTVSPTNTRP